MTSIPATDPGPIGEVREGMAVVDSADERVGKVKDVKMGDPEAATEEGQRADTPGSFADRITAAFGAADPTLPDAEAARLLRLGYVRVDTSGLFATDTYVGADQIAGVTDETVRLNVAKSSLHGG